MLRKIIQIVAGLLLVAALVFPPFKFVVVGEHSSYEGFLGYYLILQPPENSIEVMHRIRERRTEEGTATQPFNHMTDSIRAEVDPLRLLAEVFGIIIVAGILTAILDRAKK